MQTSDEKSKALPPLPEWVYHGTSKENAESIGVEGVQAPSHWASNFETAQDYANSFGDGGVVLATRIACYEFKANTGVAACQLQNGDLAESEMPDERDLRYSLEYLEGIVCVDTVTAYEEVTGPQL